MNLLWLLIGLALGVALATALLGPRLRAQGHLSDTFKALSADALKASISQLSELNQGQLQAVGIKAAAIESAVDSRRKGRRD